jgi:Icc-related predicted phosphoesterase
VKVVCISDTHGKHRQLQIPKGDILIHAGDITNIGELNILEDFNTWLGELNFSNVICIAGNHDFCFSNENASISKEILTNAIYLENSGVKINDINFWGSPVSPKFGRWAFGKDRGDEIKRFWDMIPTSTDVLITHGPAYKILDMTMSGEYVGCQELRNFILNKINPKFHIFGHIHEETGILVKQNTTFINAAMLDEYYKARSKEYVQVFEI